MNESDRRELEILRRQHRQLQDDIKGLEGRFAAFERRLQLEALRIEALPITPAPIEPLPEVAPAPTPAAIPVPVPVPVAVPVPRPTIPTIPAPTVERAPVAAPLFEIPPLLSSKSKLPEAPAPVVTPSPAPAPVGAPVEPAVAQEPETVLRTSCEYCSGHIEFPPTALGHTIPCPHCLNSTRLQVQPAKQVEELEPSFGSMPSVPVAPRYDRNAAIPAPVFQVAPPAFEPREPEESAPASGSFELRLGTYWLVRVGIVMLLTALGFFGWYAYQHYIPHLGAGGKVAMLYLASGALLGAGSWFQRKAGRENMRNYGQVVMAGGLAAVYFTTYAAHHIPGLRVISSALLDGTLLFAWASFMVWLADRKQSEVLALFAIGLAWYTSLVTRVGVFTLYSNLLLSFAAVFFLIRNQWAALSFASLVGTYGAYGYWRFYQNGVWLMDLGMSPELLWQGVTVLSGYWIAFTAAVFLSRHASLGGGRRLSFLSLNNGAFFALTVMSMYSSDSTRFWKFCLIYGAILLALGWVARLRLAEDEQARGGYVTQGVLLVTVGLIAKFTGMQLGLMLAVESTTLLVLGHWRQSRLLIFGAHVVGALAVGWGIDGMRRFDRTGMLLGAALGGFMTFNAFWSSRREDRAVTPSIRLSAGFFSALAVLMWLVTTWANVERQNLPPVLAVEGLLLTASLYLLNTAELVIFGQIPVLLAQVLWMLGALGERGDVASPPWWNPVIVLAVSVALGHWWQRQRRLVLDESLVRLVQGIYSLAAVGVLFFWLHPIFRPEVWLAVTAGLGVVLTAYGLATRALLLAISGQFFVVISAVEFVRLLESGHPGWGFALVPMVVLLGLGTAVVKAEQWRGVDDATLEPVRQVSVLYRGIAVLMTVAWVHEYVPADHRFWVLAALGAAAFGFNGWRRNLEGLALSAILTVAGLVTFVAGPDFESGMRAVPFHGLSLLAIGIILAQQQALRRFPDHFPVAEGWNDVVLGVGGAALWLFTTRWMMASYSMTELPLAWGFLAVVFAVAGGVLRERTYGWLNLAMIAAGLVWFALLALTEGAAHPHGTRSTFAGHLFPIALLLVEQHIARRFADRIRLPEGMHHAMIISASVALWLFVTRVIVVGPGGSFLTAGWTLLAFAMLVLGFVVRERMQRWAGLGVLALALARVAIYDFWKLETLHQILSALALGIVLTALGFIYNRYQETIRKWL